MIGKTFTNNLKATRPKSLFDDPYEWAIARNLAYASIRDEVEGIIKQTNENSADTYINARNLLQNLKTKKLNQYIEAEKVTQNIDLTDKEQLNQIFMSSEIYQTINYVTRNNIVNKMVSHIKSDLGSFLNNKFAFITCFKVDKGFGNFEYNTANYAYDVFSHMKEKLMKIYDARYKKKGYDFNISNIENIEYAGRPIKFPVSFSDKGNVTLKDINYLIFKITDDVLNINYPIGELFNDLIIILNLEKMNLSQTRKGVLSGNIFTNTLKDFDKLNLVAGNRFNQFEYGKVRSLIENTNRFSPGNKLFN